ncbi:MAG TPA: hypothetical protein VMG10_07075 [Gemmataceae bacterium]|nr:hypothetical protein [Gemmataceae bacterium]
MKLDKDTLVKHQFWILLGSFLLFWFIAVLWLKVAASEPIAKAQEKYASTKKSLDAEQRNPVNVNTFLPPWNEAAKDYNNHKSVIWGKAWDFQAGMYDWPTAWQSKDMTRFQTDLPRDDRADYRQKLYPGQIDNLRKYVPIWLYPVELAGGFDQIFEPVLDEKANVPWLKWQDTPTREEVWLAQEDYWVKREVFLVIWKAMADLAFMGAPEEIKEKPDGVEARYRYRNQNWEITLNLRKNKDEQLVIGGDSTIKNLDPNHRTQPLTSAKGDGILFSIAQGPTRTEFEVKGEPVGWNETRHFSMNKDGERADYDPLDGIAWEKIKERPIYVSQGFDLTNSPIRSLRKLGLAKGAQDCRTFYWRLQPNHTLAQLDALPADPNAKQGAGGGSPGGMAGKPPGGMAGGPPGGMAGKPPGGMAGGPPGGTAGGPPGGMASANLTPNNQFDRDRYLQPADLDKKLNPPSRHLPLALRLVVMQSHMHDVLLALANSRLRMQITQVEFHHAKDYLPNQEGEKKAGDSSSRVFMGGTPGMMYGGSGQMNPGGPPAPQGGPGGMPGGGGYGGGAPPGMGGPGPMGGSGMRMPGQMMNAPPPMMMPPRNGSGRGRLRPTLAPGTRASGPRPMTGDSDSKQTPQNQQDDNLVEITIYGIATLYRRPDPPKPAEQPGQPGRPGQPTPPSGQPQSGRPGGPVPAPPPPAGKR